MTNFTFTPATITVASLQEAKEKHAIARRQAVEKLQTEVAAKIEDTLSTFGIHHANQFPIHLHLHETFAATIQQWDCKIRDLDPVKVALRAAGWEVESEIMKWLNLEIRPDKALTQSTAPATESVPVAKSSKPKRGRRSKTSPDTRIPGEFSTL